MTSNVRQLRLPPQNLEAERSALGAAMIDDTAMARIAAEGLKPEDFYREQHGLIFSAMSELFEAGRPCDLVVMGEALRAAGTLEKCGGPAYLAELFDSVGTAANADHYARIVREKSALRRILAVAGETVEDVQAEADPPAEVLNRLDEKILDIRQGWRIGAGLARLDERKITETLTAMEARAATGTLPGTPSGFYDLDKMTAGFQPGDLIILAGRTSMGKTTLALNVVLRSLVPAAVFSLEMNTDQVVQWLLAMAASVSRSKIKSGAGLSRDEIGRLTSAGQALADRQIWVDESSSLTVMEVRARSRALALRLAARGERLGLVVVDYLQLMHGPGEVREQEIAGISRGLKAVAKELRTPVLALAQLNRKVEDRSNKEPLLSDLRESGAIEQDADVVMFIHRDEAYRSDPESEGLAKLLVRKQRSGPTGEVILIWRAEVASFENADRETVERVKRRRK